MYEKYKPMNQNKTRDGNHQNRLNKYNGIPPKNLLMKSHLFEREK